MPAPRSTFFFPESFAARGGKGTVHTDRRAKSVGGYMKQSCCISMKGNRETECFPLLISTPDTEGMFAALEEVMKIGKIQGNYRPVVNNTRRKPVLPVNWTHVFFCGRSIIPNLVTSL